MVVLDIIISVLNMLRDIANQVFQSLHFIHSYAIFTNSLCSHSSGP